MYKHTDETTKLDFELDSDLLEIHNIFADTANKVDAMERPEEMQAIIGDARAKIAQMEWTQIFRTEMDSVYYVKPSRAKLRIKPHDELEPIDIPAASLGYAYAEVTSNINAFQAQLIAHGTPKDGSMQDPNEQTTAYIDEEHRLHLIVKGLSKDPIIGSSPVEVAPEGLTQKVQLIEEPETETIHVVIAETAPEKAGNIPNLQFHVGHRIVEILKD